MTKAERIKVYNKYNGRCAYCGKEIEYKDMQVYHIIPKRLDLKYKIDSMENYNPSCRRCNHCKRANPLEVFRKMLKTLHERIRQNYYICKVAEDYGIIKVEPWDGKFYFEKVEEKNGENI